MWNKGFSSSIIYIRHFRHFDYMAPVRGLLLVYRRCVADADVSSLVRFGQAWSDAVITN